MAETTEFSLKPTRLFLAVALACLGVGCTKCGPTVTSVKPDYVANPTALAFEACPTLDERGAPVKDVYPDTQKLTITNQTKVSGGLTLTLSDPAAGFTLDPTLPTGIDGLSSIELPVHFAPTTKGDHSATLTIDAQYQGTTNQTVTLVGTGRNLPAQATTETGPQQADPNPPHASLPTYATCQDGSPLFDCELVFPDTLFGQSSTMQLKLRNKGCPALKVTSLTIESSRGDSQGFTIEQPAVLPTATSPLVLSTADGTQELTLTLKWTPLDDNSGNLDRVASLVIKSNDPLYGDGFAAPSRIQLSGTALKPAIYVTPGQCDFSAPADLCGATPSKVQNKAYFRVTNEGNTPVKIDDTAFAHGGAGGRFTITGAVAGNVLQPTNSAVLEVTHTDAPLYVSDTLTVNASIQPGGAPQSAGSVTLTLFGGTKPCLTTSPANTIDFGDPQTELSAQVLHLTNGAGCGTLVVGSVGVDPGPFFSLIDPLIAPNTTVPAGGDVYTTVQYKRPASGGQQTGTLRIRSNDSDYQPEKLLTLMSNAKVNVVPIASITACTPAQLAGDPTCANGTHASLPVYYSMTTPKQITISGVTSTDPNPAPDGGVKQLTGYRFKLMSPLPGGATTAALDSNDTVITAPTTLLHLPAGVTGLFKVQLTVTNDRGQLSQNPAVMNVNVYP